MKRETRRRYIKKLKEKKIEAEYEVITDNKVASLYYYHIVQPWMKRDMKRGKVI